MPHEMEHHEQKKELPLKQALFLGFCAVFILMTRAGLRLHLGIPGHAMFFTLFFLMLARGCVPYRFAATTAGLLAGIMAIVLGLGRGGPLLLMKFAFPAVVIDIGAMLIPGVFQSTPLCALLAALAAATKLLDTYITDTLVGMDSDIILQRALLQAGGAVLFGMVGSLLIPPVMRKLNAYGVIQPSEQQET